MKKFVTKLLLSGLMMALLFINATTVSFAAGMPLNQDESNGKEYIFDRCRISYTITERHYEGYNVNVVITNISNDKIIDWNLQMVADFSIENIWNATQEINGDSILIDNAGWNRIILPDQQVSFGFCVKNASVSFPDITWMESSVETVDESDYSVDYEITNNWGQGYTGQIILINNSNSPIRDWQLSFSLDNTITNIWNAVNTSTQYGSYVLVGSDSQESIKENGKIIIGFEVNQGNPEKNPTNFKLEKRVVSCGVNSATEEPIIPEVQQIDEEGIHFTVSEDWFLGDNTYKTVYFYAAIDSLVDKVVLHDITNNVYYDMYDNGHYSADGDDIGGDNTYSCKRDIYADSSVDHLFMYEVIVNNSVKSATIEIKIAKPYSQEQLDNVDYINNYISNVWDEIPEESSIEEIYEIFYEKLTLLQESGQIEFFRYDEMTKTFETSYLVGVPLYILIKETSSDEYATDSIGGTNNHYQDGLVTSNSIPEADQGNLTGVTIAIANCFDDASFRNRYYKELTSTLSMMGAKVEFDDTVTISSLLTLINNQDIICIGAHGREKGNGMIMYDDVVNPLSFKIYKKYLDAGWIETIYGPRGKGSVYLITSDFFKNVLKPEQVNGSIMYFQSCYFLNKWKPGDGIASYDEQYANVFLDKGVACLVAGQNEVAAEYDQVMMSAFLNRVLKGATAKEALDEAKELYGINDYKYGGVWPFPKEIDDVTNGVLHLLGDENGTINTGFVNGDFEISSNAEYGKPFKWNYEGDVRLFSNLGNIWAFDSKMAFISTGIGSSDGIGLNVGQGSKLYQSFYNRNATSIVFSYDVVSEEPMEYVNSRYDDYFAVNIYDVNGVLLESVKLETVNTSSWNRIDGIDFDGGDSTTYHTGWKNQSLNISKYQNQRITIEFVVADVGDSAFDTAALIDDVIVE